MSEVIELRWVDGVLHVNGEMDFSNAHRLLREVEAAGLPADDLILDLSRLDFIDSQGCRAIIALYLARKKYNSGLVLRDPSRSVRRLLDLLGSADTSPPIEGSTGHRAASGGKG